MIFILRTTFLRFDLQKISMQKFHNDLTLNISFILFFYETLGLFWTFSLFLSKTNKEVLETSPYIKSSLIGVRYAP